MPEYFAPDMIGGRHADYFAPDAPPDTPPETPPAVVAPSRVARFAANPRVAVFVGKVPILVPKVATDELRYVGDFTSDLNGSGTTAESVTVLASGASVIGTPVVQGNLVVAKLAGIGAVTFRLVAANGERFDRTIQFVAVDDKTHVFGKDADDILFYAFDFGPDAAMWATTLSAIQAPVTNGVVSFTTPVPSGNMAVVKVSGLNTAANAVNSFTVTAIFANAEKITRTIYFVPEVH